jgi:glycosyltransferase 2 family protein
MLRSPLGIAIGLAISVVFAYIALEKISLSQVWESLSGANYVWLIPSCLLLLPIALLRAWRWRLLFNDPAAVPVEDSFAAGNVGLMFNNLLPSRAGEVPRVFALRRTTGLSAFEIGATVIVERLLDAFVLALFGVALWPLFPEETWIRFLGLFCLAVILGSLVLVAALAVFRERLTGVLLRLLKRLPFVSHERAVYVRRALSAGSAILLHPRRLTEAMIITVLVWSLGALSVWVLFPAFDIELGGAAPWLVLVANSFAVAIPSGPAGVGVYEASAQAALIAFNVSASTALSYAVVLHAVNFFPIILIGLLSSWWIARHPVHPRFSQ